MPHTHSINGSQTGRALQNNWKEFKSPRQFPRAILSF